LHGKVRFRLQRYRQRQTGLKSTYFDLTDQFQEGYTSLRLGEFVAYYAGRISYEEVQRLLVRITGAKLLSDQKIHQLVVRKAAAVSRVQQRKIKRLLEAKEMPAVCRTVDLYAAESREVVLMEDAIQVKRQKAQRERRGAAGWRQPSGEALPLSKQQQLRPKKQRVSTDVAMLQKRDGSYEHLCGGIDDEGETLYDVVEAVRAAVVKHYGGTAAAVGALEAAPPLAVVAVSDGARNIRSDLEEVFGSPIIPVILDWYHLSKKVYQLLSMVAHAKDERERMQRKVMGFLWRGEVGEALSYLRGVSPRREEALRELVGYLKKHRDEIVDYERRKQAGKMIGSGRMEKGVDQAVGYRQKKKGMSWSEKGSKAVGILRVVELNGQWEQMWFEGAAA
jgi:Uncharacterised protein family (UPF0236)